MLKGKKGYEHWLPWFTKSCDRYIEVVTKMNDEDIKGSQP